MMNPIGLIPSISTVKCISTTRTPQTINNNDAILLIFFSIKRAAPKIMLPSAQNQKIAAKELAEFPTKLSTGTS